MPIYQVSDTCIFSYYLSITGLPTLLLLLLSLSVMSCWYCLLMILDFDGPSLILLRNAFVVLPILDFLSLYYRIRIYPCSKVFLLLLVDPKKWNELVFLYLQKIKFG